MDTYLLYNGRKINIYNATFSTGDSLELSQRFSHDSSSKSQSITWRRRNTALNASLRISVTASELAEDSISITNYISTIQELCGRVVSLFWYGREYRQMIVKSVQITPEIDAISIFHSVAIALNLTEGYVPKKTPLTEVRALTNDLGYTPAYYTSRYEG